MKEAREPFRFYARFVLTFAAGRSARDLGELRAGIAELPEPVIYRHTYRFLAEHESLVPEPPNDFALWVSDALGDEALAERLEAVDTLAHNSLGELRKSLLAVVDGALARGPGRAVVPGEEFHFLGAKRYSVPTGIEARTLSELADGLDRAGPSSLYLHLYEAKLRPPLGVNDLSRWLEQELGEKDLAAAVADTDLYHATLAGVRRKISGLIRSRLEAVHAAS
jgi:hypothetical protein